MNALIKYQGRVFIVVSVALMVSVALGLNLADERYIPVIGALVVLLGMPHGAVDVVYAQRLLVLKTWRHWSLFVLGYVSLALAVIGLWWLAPTVFLVGFLLMSAYHFADDLPQGVRFLSRLAYGGSSIVLPALLHSAELTRLLGWVAGGPSALWVVPLLQQLAGERHGEAAGVRGGEQFFGVGSFLRSQDF